PSVDRPGAFSCSYRRSCYFAYLLLLPVFLLYCSGDHRDLHSFPTRRSSDLEFFVALGSVILLSVVVFADVLKPIIVRDEAYWEADRKSTRLNSSHVKISYAVFCLKKKKQEVT